MTITTPGALLIRKSLPTQTSKDNYDIYSPLDKKGVSNLVNNLIQHGGAKASTTLNDLTNLFFHKATEIGATTPLSDYHNEDPERQTRFAEFDSKVTSIMAKNLPKLEQANQLNELSYTMGEDMKTSNLKYMLSRGSTAARMAQTGARGNPMQLGQATASPMMAMDVKGHPIPLNIKHSYAEGLSSAEHLAASYGGRSSTVLAQLSTALPGALFKRLTPSVMHEVITQQDCGTKNGLPIPTSDKLSCIGRYEAATNHLIDEAYLHSAVSSGHKYILARNPQTCQAKEGICQKCYGLAANGRVPEIGVNVGVIASQSVSEVLTQAMLSTKHKGGVAGKQRNAYEEASNLLSNPENFQDEATIAEVNGKITKLHQTSLKDWEVEVDGHKHFIPNEQRPLVKLGDTVRAGDPISTGTLNPEKLVELKGAGAGRVYLANKMREIYSRDAKLDPRHFDVIARNMIKHHTITDPGESGFLPGDKVELSQLAEHFKDHSKLIPLATAEGKTLGVGILDLTPGTLLSKNRIEDLREQGIKEVYVDTSGLTAKALVPGLQNLKLLDKNWISKLAFNRLSTTIQEAAALNQTSPVHSTEPVTGYMMGNEFGEGKDGKY